MEESGLKLSAPMEVAVEGEVTQLESAISSSVSISIDDIERNVSFIAKGVETNQPRLIQRALRQHASIRKHAARGLLTEVLTRFIPIDCPSFETMHQAIEKLPLLSNEPPKGSALSFPPAALLPEVEVYLFTTIITTLLRENLNAEAAYFATFLVERIRSFNRRSLDLLSSKAFFYYAFAYEKIDRLQNIRATLMALYRTACVRHDETGQAVLLNLLLRNLLHYDLIDQAQTLSLRTTFPEHASNNQFCRYLYYMGRVQAVQLEYSEAYQRLMMASRKAPQDMAVGFNVMVLKLSVIVQLLMGDIPDRGVFNHANSSAAAALRPYLFLTQAVRNGDLNQFNDVVSRYLTDFTADKNVTLVRRLGHNVIKTGLRKLSLSYSRISLEDIANKLHLPSVSNAEYICAKAIRDGVIEATIDHENGWMSSKEVVDVYSTEEPQKVFHKRIAFCLDVYNDAVKSMRYPPDAYKKVLKSKDKPEEDEKTIEELIKEMEDDLDE